MKVISGKLHEYLGITLYYSVKVQVNTTMMDYIKESLECLDKAEPKSRGTE